MNVVERKLLILIFSQGQGNNIVFTVSVKKKKLKNIFSRNDDCPVFGLRVVYNIESLSSITLYTYIYKYMLCIYTGATIGLPR